MKTQCPAYKSPFFKRNTEQFSHESFTILEGIMYHNTVEQGSFLFWEGDLADKLFYIKQGQVKITKSTEDGKDLTLHVYQEGDLFGDISIFGEMKYSVNAEIIQNSVIGYIQQTDLEIALWQHRDLTLEFMKWMSLMHRITQTKFRDLLLYGKPGALCSTLIRLANTFGSQSGENVKISIKINNSELAELIGSTRESVNRMLSDFKSNEIISISKGYITINDMAYLRSIAHCENCPNHICRI